MRTGVCKSGLDHVEGTPLTFTDQVLMSVDINLLHQRMEHIGMDHIQCMMANGQLPGINTI
ncbi:hypothetical protein BDR04DRAFT_1009242 [Suillus decipiens]|nr:hypothetical protein BDR04DRAFT_1009242 [Suillus decipiens]